MRGYKFSSKNAYVKVEGEDSDAGSNGERKLDHLSFSYSCVKSFHKNQHIIGDLAALHTQHDYQGIDHQPGLFSLSGRRNRPICQPFYCSTVSESCSDESFDCGQKQPVIEKEKNVINTESQLQFPVKDLLLQWLKYHFKQVNSLWSFTIPKESFISKFCKRNRNMKMEMTLYSVDEDTKRKLINYIQKSNLGFEQHCNLCNETVFEIDVTPILNDTQRLQNFMSFFKSIESENCKVSNNNSPDVNEFGNNKHRLERNIIKEKYPSKKLLHELNKTRRKPEILEKRVYQTSLSSTSSEFNKKFIPKHDNVKKNSYKQDLNVETKIICPEEVSTTFPHREKKARHKSTLSRTSDAQHLYDKEAMSSEKHNTSTKQKKIQFEKLCCNLQTNDENNLFISTVDSGLSCKCLMHHNREEYYRYRNQCLFGKGDEMNNSFTKYADQRNEPCLCLYENQLRSFPGEVDYVKNVRKIKISKSDKSLASKTNFQTESDNIFVENFRRASLKRNLNSQDNCNDSQSYGNVSQDCCNDSLKHSSSRQSSSITTDDSVLVKENDLNTLAANACFESLNYCFNTFSNTTNESIVRKNSHKRNKICGSASQNSCRQLHKERSNGLENSLEISGQSKRKRDKKTVKKRQNIDFRLEDNFSSEVLSLNRNTLIKKQLFMHTENAKQKAKPTINDVIKNLYRSESKEYDYNENETNTDLYRSESKEHDYNENETNTDLYRSESKEHGSSKNDEITDGINKNMQILRNNSSKFNEIKKIFHNSYEESESVFNFNINKNISTQKSERDDCITNCGEKNYKHQPKVKLIVLRIGNSDKRFRNNSISGSEKINHKSKPPNAKTECRKESSICKGNGSVNEESSTRSWTDMTTDQNTNDCSISEDWNSNIVTDSLTSRSKSKTQTMKCPQISADLELSSLPCFNLETLVSELKNQRKEINSMKKLLNYNIT